MTEKPRFSITLDDDLLIKVDDFRHDNRISTRSQAIVRLIEMGLDAVENPPVDTVGLPEDEQLLIDGYHAADIQHQEDMRDAAQRAIERGKREGKSSISREAVV